MQGYLEEGVVETQGLGEVGLIGNRCLDLALPDAADKFPGDRPPAAVAATYAPDFRSIPFLLSSYTCPSPIF